LTVDGGGLGEGWEGQGCEEEGEAKQRAIHDWDSFSRGRTYLIIADAGTLQTPGRFSEC
jgi:hypothetical protein